MNSLFFSWKQFFFALKIIYFNWRIITLQYCDSFGNTSTWISHTCAPQSWTPSLSLPNLSLWVVPEHRLWVPFFTRRTCTHHLFSCGNVYVSVLLLMFLFKILTPFPLTPFSVFPSISVSSETWLAYFHYYVSVFTRRWMPQWLGFWTWFILASVVPKHMICCVLINIFWRSLMSTMTWEENRTNIIPIYKQGMKYLMDKNHYLLSRTTISTINICLLSTSNTKVGNYRSKRHIYCISKT